MGIIGLETKQHSVICKIGVFSREIHLTVRQLHNEVVRCLHLGLCNKSNIKQLRINLIQEIIKTDNVEIRIAIRIYRENNNRLGIFMIKRSSR
ncbi:hypothetical protein NUSPORA_02968 [Nucleospora cyclopteri]